jgi:hypothetical protein
MWGDSGLLHKIANRAGIRMRARGWRTETAVLNALSKQPGELIPGTAAGLRGRRVRIFSLPRGCGRLGGTEDPERLAAILWQEPHSVSLHLSHRLKYEEAQEAADRHKGIEESAENKRYRQLLRARLGATPTSAEAAHPTKPA